MRSAEAPPSAPPPRPTAGDDLTIVVMYHYVRPVDRERWAGIFPLEPAEFEQQLDFLSTYGDIVHPDQIDAPRRSSRPRIVLTFDDGTRDHYTTVLPILRRRGVSGLFGVISGPTHGAPMPNPHMIHWLTSKCDDDAIWNGLASRFGDAALGDVDRARRLYGRDTEVRARIKFALNFVLDHNSAQTCLMNQLSSLGADPIALARDWFVTESQIIEMHRAGMAFAIHAHHHTPYAGPPQQFHRAELHPCEAWLERLLGERVRHYIAAFGGSNTGGDPLGDLAALLAGRGYRHGYLTQAGVVRSAAATFFLPRVDAADLPPRKSRRHLDLLLAPAVT